MLYYDANKVSEEEQVNLNTQDISQLKVDLEASKILQLGAPVGIAW